MRNSRAIHSSVRATKFQLRSALVFASCTLALGACVSRDLAPLNPCTTASVGITVKPDAITDIDLLFVIDNSGSMETEQNAVRREIPRMVEVLTSGDTDGDGEPDFPPVQNLNVGVISTNAGGNIRNSTCTMDGGDDGILLSEVQLPGGGTQACSSTRFQNFQRAANNSAEVVANVQCLAALGTRGCGFEQPLEATLKALTPGSSSIQFGRTGGSDIGHADGANDGFLRTASNNERESLLAIIVVTDEDDCSVADPAVFNQSDITQLNLGCGQHGERAHDVQRYINGLLATRSDPDLLLFAAITGIPTDTNRELSGDAFYNAILGSESMQEREDETAVNASGQRIKRLVPSCFRISESGTESADPPRRIVQVAQGLENEGANVVLETICQDDYSGAVQNIVDRIASVLSGTCLPRPLVRDSEGLVSCSVVETLPTTGDITRCEQLPGRSYRGPSADGGEICVVEQLGAAGGQVPDGQGWFYDDFSDEIDVCGDARPHRVTYTAPPAPGTLVQLDCLQNIVAAPEGEASIGTGCAEDASICENMSLETRSLFPGINALACHPESNTCEAPCENDSQCAGGWVCMDDFCVNPTCGE